MDMLSWKKFFDVLSFVVVFAVPVILYLMEKAGTSLTWIFVVGWLSIAVASLYLVLSIPWVWADVPMAVQVWRISLVSATALLAVGYGAIKIWPHDSKSSEAMRESANIPKEPPQQVNSEGHGTTDKVEVKPERHGIRAPSADEIADALAKKIGPQQAKKPCRLENDQLVDCTDAEVLEWGKPLLTRLDTAIQRYIRARELAHQRFQKDHDEAALNNKLLENIDLNRYLENDYKNLVIYRAAVIEKLKGGDPTRYDPIEYLGLGPGKFLLSGGHLTLSDAVSMLADAQSVLRYLQDLTAYLAEQVEQESRPKSN